jgi:hypothetical protein
MKHSEPIEDRFVRFAILLLPLLLVACSGSPPPYVTTVGVLRPGATLTVHAGTAVVNAYQPLTGGPRDLYTISATALPKQAPPAAPRRHAVNSGIDVSAPGSFQSLLVRVPDGVNLVVQSERGNVNVTDITGSALIVARRGDVNVKVPGYAQVAAGDGNVSVMMGATQWPGTLHFSSVRGDVEVWIGARAAFTVHLHTGNGVLFTDFGLRGTSEGAAETIDGSVNGGSNQRIDIETSAGAIRLLRLQPQA